VVITLEPDAPETRFSSLPFTCLNNKSEYYGNQYGFIESGAGKVEHFSEVFKATDADAALAAGIFHRKEVPIAAVKEHLREKGIPVR